MLNRAIILITLFVNTQIMDKSKNTRVVEAGNVYIVLVCLKMWYLFDAIRKYDSFI